MPPIFGARTFMKMQITKAFSKHTDSDK